MTKTNIRTVEPRIPSEQPPVAPFMSTTTAISHRPFTISILLIMLVTTVLWTFTLLVFIFLQTTDLMNTVLVLSLFIIIFFSGIIYMSTGRESVATTAVSVMEVLEIQMQVLIVQLERKFDKSIS